MSRSTVFTLAAFVLTSAPLSARQAPAPRDSVVFSAGCFWGVQAVYEHVNGVLGATSGYTGGPAEVANYEAVSTGATGHAESVLVVYDPERVSFEDLLTVFFSVAHDPTQRDRQGPDVGPQYRSAIWWSRPDQETAARARIAQLTKEGAFSQPIVTEVNPLSGFKAAEGYHQDYLIHHMREPYIVYNDLPKLAHLREALPRLWRDDPAPWHAPARKP